MRKWFLLFVLSISSIIFAQDSVVDKLTQEEYETSLQESNFLADQASEALENLIEETHVSQSYYSENLYAKEAAEHAEKALSLLIPYSHIELVQQHIEQKKKNLFIIRFSIISLLLIKAQYALEDNQMNRVVFNVKECYKYAEDHKELLLITQSEERELINLMCQKSFPKKIEEEFEIWEKKWQHIVTISQNNPENKKIILKYTKEYGEKYLDLFLMSGSLGMAIEEQESFCINLHQRLKAMAELDSNLQNKLEENEYEIEMIFDSFDIPDILKELYRMLEEKKEKQKEDEEKEEDKN